MPESFRCSDTLDLSTSKVDTAVVKSTVELDDVILVRIPITDSS